MNGKTSELAQTHAWILAGGRGERLNPLTAFRPKPAVSFGGMFRIIDFTLSNCFHSGFDRVSLLTQYRHEDLHRYLRKGWSKFWKIARPQNRSALALLPSGSGKRYRGTADAVFRNSNLLQSDDAEFVLILSGDHIYHMDYRHLLRAHANSDADLTIATVEHPVREASHFGVVEVDGSFRVNGFEEKPENPRPLLSNPSMALVSMGIYVFKKEVLLDSVRHFCEIGGEYDFGHDVIPGLIHSVRTYAYDFRNGGSNSPRYWRDIGTLDGYYKTNMDLVEPDAPFDPFANDDSPSQPTRHPSVHWRRLLGSGRVCGAAQAVRSVLSPDVEVADGASVEESILMPGVRVGKEARLRHAIVDEGVQIPPGYSVGFDRDQDRRFHTVTDAGVVVVSRIPAIRESTVVQVRCKVKDSVTPDRNMAVPTTD